MQGSGNVCVDGETRSKTMKKDIEKLIAELKHKGDNKYSLKEVADPEAKVNVWYVIAKLEEILLEANKE